MVLGIVDRPTEDLDFFATGPDAVDRLGPALQRALMEQGLAVEARRVLPGFAEYRVSDGLETTELDLTWDTRLRQLQSTDIGPVLATDELAADKMLALLGRAEARDFVDVYRLLANYSRADLVRLASEKDRGFTAARFAEALRRMSRFVQRDFPVDTAGYEELCQAFDEWRRQLAVEQPPRHQLPHRVDPESPGIDVGH